MDPPQAAIYGKPGEDKSKKDKKANVGKTVIEVYDRQLDPETGQYMDE